MSDRSDGNDGLFVEAGRVRHMRRVYHAWLQRRHLDTLVLDYLEEAPSKSTHSMLGSHH